MCEVSWEMLLCQRFPNSLVVLICLLSFLFQAVSINKAINTQEVAVKEKHARNILFVLCVCVCVLLCTWSYSRHCECVFISDEHSSCTGQERACVFKLNSRAVKEALISSETV